MKIITTHVFPPIPDRRFDWRAVTDDYEPGDPMGEGPTEEAAIADLIEQLDNLHNDETCAIALANMNDRAVQTAERELAKARTRQEVDAFWQKARGTYFSCEPHVQERLRGLRREALARIEAERTDGCADVSGVAA